MVQRLVPEADVASARFSPDGRRVLLTTGWSARVYDIKTRKQLWKVRRPGGFAEAVYSPDGTRILTAGNSPYARVWSARTGKVLLTLGGHKRPVTSASYSPDGSLIVTTSDDWTARVWDAHTGTQRGVLAGPLDAVTSAAFAPGGQAVVTGSVDGTAHIYPASAFAPLVEIRRRANQQARVPLTRFERTELDALTSGR